MTQCDRAPEGWACRREAGHDGPCAAELVRASSVPTEGREQCPAAHPSIDTYPDGAARCELEAGHAGPHRIEWGNDE
jgi:hypothetical protein